MAVLLVLAAAGGVIRAVAPDPSTTRDIGTLLLVLWLPAVGNFIGYLMKKVPKAAPPPTHFAPEAAFSAHLEVTLQPYAEAAEGMRALATDQLATVVVGRRGFTVRFAEPIAQALAREGGGSLMLELLRPASAAGSLPAGTDFHLLVNHQPVAKGSVVRAL